VQSYDPGAPVHVQEIDGMVRALVEGGLDLAAPSSGAAKG
jgi:hypothetical protein